jgi:hypothetical protein
MTPRPEDFHSTEKSLMNLEMRNQEIARDIQQQPPTAEELRELVLDELQALGFRYEDGHLTPISDDKEFQRRLHAPAREAALAKAAKWLPAAWRKYQDCFADGHETKPETIDPQLIEVKTKKQHELFRLARYTWSLPYTKGYGRRLQFLIMDNANNKLIGILGMQSPPLSFPARDRLFTYPDGRKTELINQTMDIYTLGAIPPYARLLGAKLVALAATSNKVRSAYRTKYSNRLTEMQGRQLPAHLVALTTTSAYGRSSIYNRLHYRDIVSFQPIGFTEGYGAFHLERLYPRFRQFLEAQGLSTRGGFGRGPRIKWQTIVRTFDRIGLSRELLRHNVRREAFLIPLISNLQDYIEGSDLDPDYIDVSFEELAAFWHERWLIPRSERVDGWHAWEKDEIAKLLAIK